MLILLLIIKLLLYEFAVDPSVNDNTAIKFAARNGSWYYSIMFASLEDSHNNIVGSYSVEDNYAIRETSRYGYSKIIKILFFDYRVDFNDNGLIKLATSWEHVKVVKLLLSDLRVDPSVKIIIQLGKHHVWGMLR